jgi:hypothetical protein
VHRLALPLVFVLTLFSALPSALLVGCYGRLRPPSNLGTFPLPTCFGRLVPRRIAAFSESRARWPRRWKLLRAAAASRSQSQARGRGREQSTELRQAQDERETRPEPRGTRPGSSELVGWAGVNGRVSVADRGSRRARAPLSSRKARGIARPACGPQPPRARRRRRTLAAASSRPDARL